MSANAHKGKGSSLHVYFLFSIHSSYSNIYSEWFSFSLSNHTLHILKGIKRYFSFNVSDTAMCNLFSDDNVRTFQQFQHRLKTGDELVSFYHAVNQTTTKIAGECGWFNSPFL